MRGASLFLIGIGIAIAACSGAAGSNTNTGGASSGGSGAIGVGGSGAIGTGASSGSGGLAGGCASDTYDGELVPLDMYVMLDRSGSMSDAGKWSAVTSAINQFVQLPGIDGLGMGLGVFPKVPNPPPPPTCTTNADCGPGGLCVPIVMVCEVPDSCEPTDYAQPVVGIAPLPGVGSAITTAIGGVSPGGGTPSTPALQGAMMYSMAWAKAHTDHITVVVLATDGEPVGCSPNDVSTVSAVAAQGLAASPLVRTFVVGVGSELTALNAVAQAGGTDQAIIVSAGNAAQEFLAALNKIRGAVGCIYNIPVATGGETDPTKVNVGFTPQGGAQEIFPKVDSAAQCQGQKAWYYDDNANPSQIILCPAACDLVTNQKGKVDVVLGCATIVR